MRDIEGTLGLGHAGLYVQLFNKTIPGTTKQIPSIRCLCLPLVTGSASTLPVGS